MNEKKIFIIIISIVLLPRCSTTRNLQHNRSGAAEVRGALSELAERQTDSAITITEVSGAISEGVSATQRIIAEVEESRTTIKAIEDAVGAGAGESQEFAEILREIRKRKRDSDRPDER